MKFRLIIFSNVAFILMLLLVSCDNERPTQARNAFVPQITDSIKFDPFVVELINQGKFMHPDCIAQKSQVFLKDSIYKEAMKHSNAFVLFHWYIHNEQYWIFIPKDASFHYIDYYNNYETKQPKFKKRFVAKNVNGLFQNFEKIKTTNPNFHYSDDILADGGDFILFWDGTSFYGLNSRYGQIPGDFVDFVFQGFKNHKEIDK